MSQAEEERWSWRVLSDSSESKPVCLGGWRAMSGGATGLGGYVYQQDYLAYRGFASVVART